jgi:hypothetical protein
MKITYFTHLVRTLFLAAVILTMTSMLTSANAAKPGQKNKVDYLVIETAEQGELHYDSDKKLYVIVLKNINPWVIYFSNAPKRKTEYQTVENFIGDFVKEVGARKHGLNAALIALNDDEKKTRLTFTMQALEYSRDDNTLTITAHMLPGGEYKGREELSFKHPALFVDACASCGGRGF